MVVVVVVTVVVTLVVVMLVAGHGPKRGPALPNFDPLKSWGIFPYADKPWR